MPTYQLLPLLLVSPMHSTLMFLLHILPLCHWPLECFEVLVVKMCCLLRHLHILFNRVVCQLSLHFDKSMIHNLLNMLLLPLAFSAPATL